MEIKFHRLKSYSKYPSLNFLVYTNIPTKIVAAWIPCAVLATCSNLHSGHKSRARCTAGSSLAHVPAAGTAYLCIHFLKSLKAWRNLVVQMTFKPSQPKLCYDYKGPSNAMVPREAPTHIPMGGQATRGPGWGYSGPGLGKGTHARKSLTTVQALSCFG